ncbi:hypothetical protein BC829DRAFT_297844 [Chytridium lagenaria]|nr:hypothetical protein BC829DRAFT_297844 [Chytridium lagenaria]
MFFAKIVAIATLALGASASLVAGDYDGSAAVVSSSAPVVAATTTVSPIASSTQAPNKPKKCKKWTKKPEYVKKAVEAGLATGATASFDDAGLPQLIGEGGFQVAEEQQPVNEAPVVVQEPVAQEPVVQVPSFRSPLSLSNPLSKRRTSLTLFLSAPLSGVLSVALLTRMPLRMSSRPTLSPVPTLFVTPTVV